MAAKLRWLVLAGIAWFYLHSLWVLHEGSKTFTGKADVAIVLGTTANLDGTLSPWLQGRVDEALRLYRENQVKKIVVSGGIYTSNFAEGDAMNYYLLDHGVDSSDIIVDNYGDNTYLTAKNFLDHNRQENFSSAVMVSSFYHVPRCEFIMRKLGFENVSGSGSKAYFPADWYALGREFVAFYYYLFAY